ncbi:phosphatase PAP2 family protein [Cellvibrio sp. pealriver]|uniref:phosphatase PAP2 family protein n=1 Tax=Cellvibrio sp. pealriver TaxID=1622269 RepID=UPI00066FBD0E|nr:phosphatase PAP2 family protein [Cellvibrio sp. pealriver]
MRLADYVYSLQGHNWAWKNAWLLENVIHKGGRALSLLMALLLLIVALASFAVSVFSPFKKTLIFLFIATASGSVLVSLLKSSLAVSCPWEFHRYGGDLVYASLIEQLLLRNGDGCFPAGHASAGYAWVSGYFVGFFYQARWRWWVLFSAITAGALFGFAQQLRGAHFISHDLWSLAVCWFVSLWVYVLFFKKSICVMGGK